MDPNTLQRHRQDYASAWEVTSRCFAAEGHYDWMASQLAGCERVLEIGCGAGYSSLALCAAGHRLVAVDENPACVTQTSARLRAAGHEVSEVLRGRIALKPEGRYAVNYTKISQAPAQSGLVLEADAMGDARLRDWLAAGPRFDAVACWLIGTHNGRGGNTCLQDFRITNAGQLRQMLQRKVYELAALCLAEGGRLNIIDRMLRPDTPKLEAELLASHARLAHGTGLHVTAMATRPYQEPEAQGAKTMVVSQTSAARQFDPGRLALVSIIAEKRADALG